MAKTVTVTITRTFDLAWLLNRDDADRLDEDTIRKMVVQELDGDTLLDGASWDIEVSR